ncbi:MAG: PilZ domain-containing protein [Gammaproteobacteria bacterium]|nr:PilZ domain-containing protein [Gammaproteobacteria bacterium]
MQEDNTAIRRHVRHVTGIPIEINLEYHQSMQAAEDSITNVSLGGLCFIANDRLEINEAIQVRFPVLDQEKLIDGKVVWCNKIAKGYEVGLEFNDPAEVDRLKMIDQIRQIEDFRNQQENQDGRQLSSEQAAREWISKYAGDFSALN